MGDSTGVDGFEPDDASFLDLSDDFLFLGRPRRAGWPGFRFARGRKWPGRAGFVVLFILFAGSVFGLGGSIHSYARDLGTYDAYRAAPSCSASDAADGNATSEYCDVSDGSVDAALAADAPIYSLGVGPSSTMLAIPGLAVVTIPDTTGQQAFFDHDESALAGLQVGDPVDYVTLNGGNVASVTVHGVTYQTLDSPQSQQLFDTAGIVAASACVLLFGFWLVLRLARRRLTTAWSAPLVACATALAAALATAGTGPGDVSTQSVGSLVLRTVLISLAVTLVVSVLRILLVRRIAAAQSSAAAMSSA